MRVLQLIDSLEPGGAERVAVNFANGLKDSCDKSFLCTSRKEGILKASIENGVGYLFLNKTSTLDFKALKLLNKFVKKEQIDIIHAHSSSYFLPTLLKLINRNIKIVWHDHYGNSEFLHERKSMVLKLCSYKFKSIISVNSTLKNWALKNLKCKHVSVLTNFVDETNNEIKETTLKGKEGKRIVCMANLRPQKNHELLIDSFSNLNDKDWTLHLVGKDFNDDYSEALKNKISELNLSNSVFIYGSCPDTSNILNQCDIGVLSSKSEGLPLSLLEYGVAKLPVVVTNVGDCNLVVSDSSLGRLIPSNNSDELTNALIELMKDVILRKQLGNSIFNHVEVNFGKEQAIKKLIQIYQNI